MYIELLKEMFFEMVVKKDITLIPYYYHTELLLFTNDERMDYNAFLECHEQFYKTAIKYEVVFDEDTFLEQNERVAGRVWITTTIPNDTPKPIEVILIAQYKDKKIYRIWELTYPDWSKMPTFNQPTKCQLNDSN
jgi:hypothetical protein